MKRRYVRRLSPKPIRPDPEPRKKYLCDDCIYNIGSHPAHRDIVQHGLIACDGLDGGNTLYARPRTACDGYQSNSLLGAEYEEHRRERPYGNVGTPTHRGACADCRNPLICARGNCAHHGYRIVLEAQRAQLAHCPECHSSNVWATTGPVPYMCDACGATFSRPIYQ